MEASAAVAAVFEPVAPPTTFEQTVERLGNAIKLGLLAPGTRLPPERELANQLGISRSTLRNALTTLVQSGHLVSVRGRSGGTFVVESPPLSAGSVRPSPAVMKEVLDGRVAVEIGAVVLAVERAGSSDLERMERLVDRMSEARRFDAYRRADTRFHIALAEAARSPRLLAEMTDIQGEMSELIALIPHPERVLTRSNAQHARLVHALGRRDAARSVRVIREHLAGTEHILAGLMPGEPPDAGARADQPRSNMRTRS
jgi:GntR family transcriptional regulator, transcriptional repressor for pyruvate dehydrogenase complex